MSLLDQKVIVVTGGGRGIGQAVARAAAAAGACVVVADAGVALDGSAPSSEIAEQVVEEIRAAGGRAVAVTASVATLAGAREIIEAGLDTFGAVHGAVCCAGILRHRPLAEMSEEDWDAVIAVHLKGHFTIFREAIRAFPPGAGSLVGLSSGYVLGDPDRANYRAAKAGVIALMQSAALLGEGTGFRANCISPRANTRMTEASGMVMDGNPDDVAPVALYLLSDLSVGVNGQVFSVMGAEIARWQGPLELPALRHPDGRWTPEDIDRHIGRLLEAP